MRAGVLLACLALAACRREEPAASGPLPSAPAKGGAPAAAALVSTAPERRFGEAPTISDEPLPVARVLEAPDMHLNKVIRCEGTVARVCQAAGCWLELRGPDSEQSLRVPMAGHSFFVPADVVGHRAVVEGRLASRELDSRERSHLEGEGLKANGPLYLAATSVVVR